MKINILNFSVFVFLLVTLVSSCSKKIVMTSSNSSFKDKAEIKDLRSNVTINYKVDKDSINQTFNTLLDSLFSYDMGVTTLGFEVEILNLSHAKLEVQGKQVLTELPLQINLTKETFLMDMAVDGKLEVTFITDLEIDSSWNLKTETSLEDYEWIEKPELSLGSLNISIKSLTNLIIEKYKEELETQIDKTILEQFQLKRQVEKMMLLIKDPILIDSTLSKWVNLRADSIELSQIENRRDFFIGHVSVFGKSSILDNNKDNNLTNASLPQFKWAQPDNLNSQLRLYFDLPYDKLNEFLNENYANQPLENDGKEIVLSNILLNNESGQLILEADVSGDFNGTVRLQGDPVFDSQNQRLITEDIEIDFQTSNILHKAGIWIMKGKINKTLSSMLNFSLKDKVDDIQNSIDNQVKELRTEFGIDITCDINEILFEQLELERDGIQVYIILDFLVETTIYNLLKLDSKLLNNNNF